MLWKTWTTGKNGVTPTYVAKILALNSYFSEDIEKGVALKSLNQLRYSRFSQDMWQEIGLKMPKSGNI